MSVRHKALNITQNTSEFLSRLQFLVALHRNNRTVADAKHSNVSYEGNVFRYAIYRFVVQTKGWKHIFTSRITVYDRDMFMHMISGLS